MFDQKFLNWVTNKDHATTMMTTLEKGLDRVGFVRYDANCPKPCPSGRATEQIEGAEEEQEQEGEEDLFYYDTCEPVGIACGSCDGEKHIDVH